MIIITGASRGIGAFLLDKYLQNNEKAIGFYNSSQIKPFENIVKVNVTNKFEIEKFISNHQEQLNQITLINAAGTNYNSVAHKADIDKWFEVIRVNLFGTFNVIHSFLPIMREQNFGRIINFSSIVPQKGIPGTSAYAASKSGLWGMTKSIAKENASKGITINNLNLGYFNIGMISEVPMEIQEVIKKEIPVKDFGHPDDIFNTIEYIRNTPYLTGTSIDVNGGLF
jgi:NAD(P)-dependent dehydrogenase (short-subunit alcohol dehydrogenase family)